MGFADFGGGARAEGRGERRRRRGCGINSSLRAPAAAVVAFFFFRKFEDACVLAAKCPPFAIQGHNRARARAMTMHRAGCGGASGRDEEQCGRARAWRARRKNDRKVRGGGKDRERDRDKRERELLPPLSSPAPQSRFSTRTAPGAARFRIDRDLVHPHAHPAGAEGEWAARAGASRL